MFDQSPIAIRKADKELGRNPKMGDIIEASMEDFEWNHDYSGIFMVWCSGYLDDSALVTFLKKAKARLHTAAGPSKRKSRPASFIFLLDNVLEEGYEKGHNKGQRFRTEL